MEFLGRKEMNTQYYPKARIKWLVLIENGEHSYEGVTLTLNPNGAYISCGKPLSLNQVCDVTIDVPDSDSPIKAKVEVVFSNKYGPDDEITPRGMGVRFLNISGGDRKVIAKEVLQHLKSDKEEIDPKLLQTLETIIFEKDQIPSEADSVAS
jgi:hypothetical protein